MTYDGPSIYRAPIGNSAARKNFEATVLEGVERDRVADHTETAPKQSPVRAWGTKETVKGTWEDIEPGDFLIFYRDGVYEYAAKVIDTEENESLGRDLWPNHEEDKPWLCVIYLEEPVKLDVDSSEVHELAGYDIDYPMGFSPLNEMGVGGIRGRYGSVEAFIHGEEPTGVTDRPAQIEMGADPDFHVSTDALDNLYFPEEYTVGATEIVSQINDALNAGKHVIFTGPPGTGKTEIARRIAGQIVDRHEDAFTGFQTTTATADWSTFETVGGYMPAESGGGDLDFTPGQILRCFKNGNEQRNELLIIDEINRSDIDKSFGQLFTVLSGQAVQLPFTKDGNDIEIRPWTCSEGSPDSHQYYVPPSWRIFATMNSYDKTSLYEMSYAFMRRFAFIYVEAPTLPDSTAERGTLVADYADVWGIAGGQPLYEAVGNVWHVMNVRFEDQPIGPAIIRDILTHVTASDLPMEQALTDALVSYVIPQLEGVRRRDRIISALASLDSVQPARLRSVASDVLQVQIDE